jgi:hypothetical protein
MSSDVGTIPMAGEAGKTGPSQHRGSCNGFKLAEICPEPCRIPLQLPASLPNYRIRQYCVELLP